MIYSHISASRVWCTDEYHLKSWVESITEEKGEGTILRLHNSAYIHGKTQSLLKFKARKTHNYSLSHRTVKILKQNWSIVQACVPISQKKYFEKNI
jgi:ATP-dependent DNA ligase